MRKVVNLPDEADTIHPFVSGAVIADNLVFASGHVGWERGSRQAPKSIEAQTAQTLENLKELLEAAGTSLDYVVKVNVYLTNIDHFDAMNQVYRRYFPIDAPARTTVGVAALAGSDLLIEMEMVALVPGAGAN